MLKKVLVVDDESSIANLIADVVGLLGCETRILGSGKEVLAIAKEWQPDLISLDIMMPVPDGTEVLSQLKSDPETKNIPVFIISVVANNRELSEKVSLAENVLEKPIDVKQLSQHIRKLFEQIEKSKLEVEK